MKTKEEVMIEVARKLHRAVVHAIELDLSEDADPDALVDAAIEFESVFYPITPKDFSLVRILMQEDKP